jgi:hypothetical protein
LSSNSICRGRNDAAQLCAWSQPVEECQFVSPRRAA